MFWTGKLLPLGYHVDLQASTIALPDPKQVGAFTLTHAKVCDPGNYAIPLLDMQELRGGINHWRAQTAYGGGMLNQVINYSGRSILLFRSRRADSKKMVWFLALGTILATSGVGPEASGKSLPRCALRTHRSAGRDDSSQCRTRAHLVFRGRNANLHWRY